MAYCCYWPGRCPIKISDIMYEYIFVMELLVKFETILKCFNSFNINFSCTVPINSLLKYRGGEYMTQIERSNPTIKQKERVARLWERENTIPCAAVYFANKSNTETVAYSVPTSKLSLVIFLLTDHDCRICGHWTRKKRRDGEGMENECARAW